MVTKKGATQQALPAGEVNGRQELPEAIAGQTTKTIGSQDVLGTEFDIPEDAYGAMMVAVVRDATFLMMPGEKAALRQLAKFRIILATMTMVLNLVLQCGLLYFIHVYVVQTSVRAAQIKYKNFMSAVFDETTGEYNKLAWLEFQDKNELCQIAIMYKPFWMIVLSVWTLVMIGEARSSYRFHRNIQAVPAVRKTADQLALTSEYRAGQGECLCVGMTWKTRVAVYFMILGPKYLVLVGLLVEGSRWLATAMSITDALLNGVALQFVIHIDEMIYHTLLPAGQQKEVTDTNFWVTEKPVTWDTFLPKLRNQFNLSVKCIVAVFVWTIIFTWCIQDVLPYHLSFVRDICTDYMNFRMTPICTRFSALHMNEECYPKGG